MGRVPGLYFINIMIYELTAEEIAQAKDVEKALDSFTRAVQLDPENGEAWNNIACLYALFTLHNILSVYSPVVVSHTFSTVI